MRCWLHVATSLLSVCTLLPAAELTGEVHGAAPLNISAELESNGTERFTFRAAVGEMGDFRFEHVPPGRYELRLLSQRSEVIYRQVMIVEEPMTHVLARIAPANAHASPGTVSAAELAHRVPRAAQKEFRSAARDISDGRLRDAIRHLQKTVQLDPGYARAYNNLGACWGMLNDFEKAEPALRRAVMLAPDSPEAHVNLGQALISLSRFDEAEREARHALQLAPLYQKAHYILGLSLQGERRADEARAAFVRASELAASPKRP